MLVSTSGSYTFKVLLINTKFHLLLILLRKCREDMESALPVLLSVKLRHTYVSLYPLYVWVLFKVEILCTSKYDSVVIYTKKLFQ